MKTQTVCSLLSVLLLAVLDFSSAEDIPSYFKDGGDLVLRPSVTDSISNIVWKHNGDLIAELVDPKEPIDYYPRFRDRVTLNKTSGVLMIKNLNSSDVGTFTVEINNRVFPQRYIGKIIKVTLNFQIQTENSSIELRIQQLVFHRHCSLLIQLMIIFVFYGTI